MVQGRHSEYTQEMAEKITERLANGESLRAICADDGMPSKATIFKWLSQRKDFADQYARAREEQAESFAMDIVSIADGDGTVEDNAVMTARDRLKVDARKWVASKLKPKVYGDRQVIAGDPEAPLVNATEEQLDARINALLKAALDTGQIE